MGKSIERPDPEAVAKISQAQQRGKELKDQGSVYNESHCGGLAKRR